MLYDMIHPHESQSATVRSLFVIGPDKRVKLILVYPMSTGRDFAEVLHALDSPRLADKHPVATPADWQPGQDVIVGLGLTDEQAADEFPGFRTLKPHLRFTAEPAA